MSLVGRMIFRAVLTNNGIFPGPDREVFSCWTFTDRGGALSFKLCWHEGTEFAFRRSPNCTDLALCWSKRDGLTAAGKAFLRSEHTRQMEKEDE